MSLAILVPVLGRPHRVRPLVESIAMNTPVPYRVVFIASPGDTAEHVAIRQEIERSSGIGKVRLLIVDGNYAQKINAAVSGTYELLLFTGADDLNFHAGWFDAAVAKMVPGVGVVGTNDLCNRRVIEGDHATHLLVARWYAEIGTIDEPGKLLHESYPHEFVDDEFVQTAKHRGAYAHAHDSIVEHLHPDVGKAPMDHLYAARRRRMRAGRLIFDQRRSLWT